MPSSTFEADLQQAIVQRYCEKYGHVQIQFEVIQPLEGYTAQVQFTISDDRGFITRYYGQATYQAEHLQMSVRSI
jgi:hypothetical protein